MISAITSTTKSITTTKDETLTCTIGELDASGTAVTVSWKDPEGGAVSESDTTNYELTEGTVSSEGIQLAELVIKSAKLAGFSDQDSVTYTCSVRSSLYPDSPVVDHAVVAKIEGNVNVRVRSTPSSLTIVFVLGLYILYSISINKLEHEMK